MFPNIEYPLFPPTPAADRVIANEAWPSTNKWSLTKYYQSAAWWNSPGDLLPFPPLSSHQQISTPVDQSVGSLEQAF
jgi:hypothetical protein